MKLDTENIKTKNVLITGANGFLGARLKSYLVDRLDIATLSYTKTDELEVLQHYLSIADIVFHLAGVNRPQEEEDFYNGNYIFTKVIIDYLLKKEKAPRIIFSSSTQAELDNAYGKSKHAAEKEILRFKEMIGADIYIYRFPNIFGKGARPNYNSAITTFLYNISHNKDIEIHDPHKIIILKDIEDVISIFTRVIEGLEVSENGYCDIGRTYSITLGELVECIYDIKNSRKNKHEIFPVLSKVYNWYARQE